MAEWIAPVYNRTAADVAAGAEKCYFSAEALNRIEGNLQYLADLLGAVGVHTRSWTSTDFLRLSDMQRILANLAAVRDAYHAMPGSPDIPELPATLWSDVNAIEEITAGILDLWQRNQNRLKLYAGEVYAGGMGVI